MRRVITSKVLFSKIRTWKGVFPRERSFIITLYRQLLIKLGVEKRQEPKVSPAVMP